jgi:hypothetical protein
MRIRVALFVMAAAASVSLAACGTYEAALDPALFHAPAEEEAEASRAPGAVLIRLPADSSGLVVTGGGLHGSTGASTVRTPVGEITAAAAQLAFEREFAGGVRVARQGAGAEGSVDVAVPWQVTVEPGALHFDFRDDLVYWIPIPLSPVTWIEERDVTVRMAIEVRVVDDVGTVRWSRSYDAGRELWKPPRGLFYAPLEPPEEGVRRLAHEQAYRLMRRAAHDVRLFVEADRRRERVL